MSDKPNIIGIIPARGGSKGVSRKNIKLLGGKPLIWYTINEAKKSRYLSNFKVSTEDKEIAEVARQYDVEVIDRPSELAKDDTPARPVYQHAIKYLEEVEKLHPDIIVILQPTTPCRLAEDIDSAIDIFLKTDCDSVVSICEAEYPPHWTFTIKKDRLKPMIPDWQNVYQRQKAPKTFRLNGTVYVIHHDVIMKHTEGLLGNNICPYIMPPERSVDIDNEIDFALAEVLIKRRE